MFFLRKFHGDCGKSSENYNVFDDESCLKEDYEKYLKSKSIFANQCDSKQNKN